MAILPALPVAQPPLSSLLGAEGVGRSLQVPREIPAPDLTHLALAQPSPAASPGAAPSSFEDVLGRMVGEVNHQQLAASGKVEGLLSGQNVSLHEAMVSMEEASLSFQLMVEVRNKLLESYQELMRMQV